MTKEEIIKEIKVRREEVKQMLEDCRQSGVFPLFSDFTDDIIKLILEAQNE